MIESLPLSSAAGYILHAIETEREQAAWELWSRTYPFMAAGLIEHKPFDEFMGATKQASEVKGSGKTRDEIEAEMEAVIAKYEGQIRSPSKNV